jgi:hypothetical protein
MPAQHPANERRIDRDGVVRIEQRAGGRRPWVLGLAIVVVYACLAGLAWVVLAPADEEREPSASLAADERPSRPAAGSAPAASAQPVPQRPARPGPAPAPQPAPSTGEAPEEGPAPALPIEMDPHGPSGIALFPPPGTKPIKKGLVVPEGFELPPGYVRHYQSTDDGQQVPAILMFHPDYKPVDANGQPIPLPANRIVPPEMAPPGMPIQTLDLPKGEGGSEQAP